MIDSPIFMFGVFPLAAYVIGSTPFGVLIARMHGKDLRSEGSGNVGATNCGRVVGRTWGYACFLLDLAKGLVPSLTVVMLTGQGGGDGPAPVVQAAWLVVGMGCILGHVFSFYLGFRGGKGVATALGVVLGIYPYFTLAGLAAMGIWIIVTLASRYVSLGSISAAVAFVPLLVAFNFPPMRLWPLGSFAIAMAALIIVRHRGNISRLLAGTENKIGRRKSTSAPGSDEPAR